VEKEVVMPAHKPEECDILVERALKSRDLEAAVALYEPNASFVLASGEVVTGHTAIREALKGFFAFDDNPLHKGNQDDSKR
jgi:ketosteroid isomerase-like protein